jgi:pimeloyl-ACP methyl ester carboxylesterase
LAATLVVAVVAGVLAAVVIGRQPSVPAVGAPLSWHSCDGQFLCAEMGVPISYGHPDQGTLGIALVELPATGSATADLVTNPGGPGVSGIQDLEEAASMYPASLRRHVNIVSFDPRGIGASDPVHCLSAQQIRAWLGYDPDPLTPAAISADVAQSKQFVDDCLSNNSRLLLANLGTDTVARDLDQLRAELHQPRLDYLGFSYGTYLGERYAERFPHRVGHFVLDGVVDPDLSDFQAGAQQAIGFEDNLTAFSSWCAGNAACRRRLPAGGLGSWRRLATELTGGQTITAYLEPQFGGTFPVDLGMAETGVVWSLYTPQLWPDLGQALQSGLAGDGSDLAFLAEQYADLQQDGSFSNETDANMAIGCDDGSDLHSLAAYESLANRFRRVAPDFGTDESWGGLPCLYWPYRGSSRSAPVHAPGTPTVLVVGSTNDPATPYAEAQAVAHQFPHAVLLTRRGSGHTAYDASACIRNYVDAFVEHGTLPPPNTVCASS